MPKEVLLLPVRAVDKSIISMFMIFILLFVATLICVFVVAHRLSERLTRPLVQLRRDVKKISGGNLKYDAKVYENDEIGDLANDVNQMAVSLRRYVEYGRKRAYSRRA